MVHITTGSSISLNSALDIQDNINAKEIQKNTQVKTSQNTRTSEDDEIVVDLLEDDIDDAKTTDYNQKDGTIGTAIQKTGDCWLLSGINGLSYTKEGANIIKNALEYQDGKTTVYLKGLNTYYTITDKEIEIARNEQKCSKGDDDVAILELAITKARQDIQEGKILLDKKAPTPTFGQNSIEGGDNRETLFYLTGKTGEWVPPNEDRVKANEMLQAFQDRDDYVITASKGSSETVQDVNGKEVNLAGSHAYSIKNVDGDTVTVINPWDSNKEIILSKDTFLNAFEIIEGLDLSENNPEKDYVIETDRTTKNYKDGSKLETIKDKDGNIIAKMKYDKDGTKLFNKRYFNLDSGNIEVKKETYNKDGDNTKTTNQILKNGIVVYQTTTEYNDVGEISRQVYLKRDDEGKKTERNEYKYKYGKNVYTKESSYNKEGGIKKTETTTKRYDDTINTKTIKNYDKNKKLKSAVYEEYGNNSELLRSKHDKNGDGEIDSAKYYIYDSEGNLSKIKIDKDNNGMIDKTIDVNH